MADYLREEKPADFLLPDSVKNWFTHMYTHMISGNVEEMGRLYERDFVQLTNNYFKQSSWPDASSVASLVDEDPNFLVLYKQLAAKHLFSKILPTMERRKESWENYCGIFDGFLKGSLDVDTIPPQWAFDIIAEFVYQYQSFCQQRAKLATKSESEIAHFRDYDDSWDTPRVLGYLEAMINRSRIADILKAENAELDEIPTAPSEALKQLGLFSLVGLSRAYVLFGDYHGALEVLSPIQFSKKGLFAKAPHCLVSVHYHMGLAQLMLQRFSDAIRSFSTIHAHVSRNRQYYSRATQHEQLIKWNEKSMALLTIAVALCPGHKVDDQANSHIREKLSDKLVKMQRGELSAYLDLFQYATPKFIDPASLDFDDLVSRGQEAQQLQLNLFTKMVEQRIALGTVRSYLGLYKSMKLSKLAHFRDMDEDAARSELIALKCKSFIVRNKARDPILTGEKVFASDIHFYLHDDVVHVDDAKVEDGYGDFFLGHMHKFSDIINKQRTK